MTNEEILALDRFTCAAPKPRIVSVCVFMVMRCNFNDERLIADLEFNCAEQDGKPIEWIDPYLGKNPKSLLRIAFAYADNEAVYFIEETNGQRNVIKKPLLTTRYYTDDFDKSCIIAVHIH